MRKYPVTSATASSVVDGSSRQFSTTMVVGATYVFCSTVACFILQGANPTATNASMFWPANEPIEIKGDLGAKLAVLQQSGAGTASLTRFQVE